MQTVKVAVHARHELGHACTLQIMTLDETMSPGIGHLAWGVRTGGYMFEHAMPGQEMWSWLHADPSRMDRFNRGMAQTDNAGCRWPLPLCPRLLHACMLP